MVSLFRFGETGPVKKCTLSMDNFRGTAMSQKLKKLALITFFMLLIIAYSYFDLGETLNLETFWQKKEALLSTYEQMPSLFIGIFGLVYIITTAASLPGAAVLTIVAGALFGLTLGTIVVSFSSTIGATLAFLVSRYLFQNAIQKKFQSKLKAINEGIKREGAFYLFTLRLVPLFPFFLINLVMGLTPIKTRTFFWVSQLGMLPGTVVYVNVGTQLSQINLDSTSGILTPELIFSFILLGLFPLIAKKLLAYFKKKRAYHGLQKPKTFDYNLVVIGAGSAGLVSAYIAATVKAKVALIEKNKMGGDCLNTGCVPSKALIKSAKVLHTIQKSKTYGIHTAHAQFDFSELMQRVQSVIQKIEPHDSVERYSQLGVECIQGEATIEDPWRVQINGKTLTTRSIIIATGARPFVPPIAGIEEAPIVTSDTIWEVTTQPKKMVVLGGGPIGSELTQAFARLGTKVIQVEKGSRILSKEDPEVSEWIKKQFESEGIEVLTGHEAIAFKKTDNGHRLICKNIKDQSEREIDFDLALIAVGRKPNVEGFGLEKLHLKPSPSGTISHDLFLQTQFPNILVCGDVAGPYQLTHVSAHQAWFASVNALFGGLKKFKADYRVIPWATFVDPEVARVGLNEEEAKSKEIDFETTTYGIDDLDRAITESENHGWIKVLTPPNSDQILGVTIVGPHASELISEFIFAMKHGLGLKKILGTIHIYPTLSEANKYAAGEWARAHSPKKLLEWVQRYHDWKRS